MHMSVNYHTTVRLLERHCQDQICDLWPDAWECYQSFEACRNPPRMLAEKSSCSLPQSEHFAFVEVDILKALRKHVNWCEHKGSWT